jgi:hypothetical protein
MELAKNNLLGEKLRNAQDIAMYSDYTTVGDKSVQGTHLRTFNFEEGGTDGACTTCTKNPLSFPLLPPPHPPSTAPCR